jgi:hypothetical protein
LLGGRIIFSFTVTTSVIWYVDGFVCMALYGIKLGPAYPFTCGPEIQRVNGMYVCVCVPECHSSVFATQWQVFAVGICFSSSTLPSALRGRGNLCTDVLLVAFGGEEAFLLLDFMDSGGIGDILPQEIF